MEKLKQNAMNKAKIDYTSIYNNLSENYEQRSLPARETQIELIKNSLISYLKSPGGPGHIFYLYGQPGTGKTAVVQHVCKQIKMEYNECEYYIINCLAINSTKDLFLILYQILISNKKISAKLARQELSDYFNSEIQYDNNYIIVLDEFENLFELNEKSFDEKIFELFSWSHQKNSNISIICIANGVYLLKNIFSPKTQSRLGSACINFPTYSWEELKKILIERLIGYHDELFDEYVFEILCRKISARTGDIRQVLALVKTLIKTISIEKQRKISIDDVLNTINLFYENLTITSTKNSSFYAKILLGCIMILVNNETLMASCISIYDKFKYELLKLDNSLDLFVESIFISSLNELIGLKVINYINYLEIEINKKFDKQYMQNNNSSTPFNKTSCIQKESSNSLFEPFGQWTIQITVPMHELMEIIDNSNHILSKLRTQIENKFVNIIYS